ncbi:hypothetical protein PVAND_012873 [Polypedilum vanderplanki]|uniref:Insulin-degrading enzyme n=1 Tax=Polypedilum vanderplanki TaxID=319348 RepID=A0A9J6CNS3_POLVA|nr:hypothetical protein PVAND_012873 [Polypedilum vanderplanki]
MEQVEILTSPIKSESDKKEYRLIKLQNGLKVLLIKSVESETEQIAAAALTISIGSFHESTSINGLAHFLEHCLFLGSENYPNAKEFSNFIFTNGGFMNAKTTNEFTSYYLSIFEELFDEALDRFVDMITKPLLPKDSILLELEAVDLEFQMTLNKNESREKIIFQKLFQESHPASKLNYGNLETLKENISEDELHAAVLQFFKKYVANKMFLCLQSHKSLEEMQQMVIEKFGKIKKEEEENFMNEFEVDKIMKPNYYEKILHVKPLKAAKRLKLSWILPQQISNDSKPLKYFEKIFDNNCIGGIVNWLKENNLVTNFYVEPQFNGYNDYNRQFCIFTLLSEIIDYGMKNIEKVLDAIFSYLLFLKETPIETHKKLFEQFKRQSEIDFRFIEEEETLKNVANIAQNNLYYKDIDILRKSSSAEFNEQEIADVINRLNEMRFVITITDSDHDNYSKIEKYSDIEYDLIDMPESYKTLWKNRRINEEFSLPLENPFEPTDFDIKINAEESQKFPKKILEDSKFEVWHKLDDKFNLPKAMINIEFMLGNHLDTIENFLFFEIYKSAVNFQIQKKLSQALVSGFKFDMKTSSTGIIFKFSGFSDKLELFIDMFFRKFTNVAKVMTEDTFKMILKIEKKKIVDKILNLTDLFDDFRKKFLLNKWHTQYDLYKILESATCEKIQNFIPSIFEKLKMKILAQGNITKNDVIKIVKILDWSFGNELQDEELENKPRAFQFPLNINNILRLKSPSKNDDNSLIAICYQIGQMTLQGINLGRFFENYFCAKAFDILRTQQQLGYDVKTTLEVNSGTLSFVIYVVSLENKHNFIDVHKKIVECTNKILTDINHLTDEEVEKLKKNRLKVFQSDDFTLKEEISRNWKTVKRGHYMFEKQEIYANVTAKLTKEDFIYFGNSFLKSDKQRSLSIQIIGNKNDQNAIKSDEIILEYISEKYEDDENVIIDIEEFQKNLYLYPSLKVLE